MASVHDTVRDMIFNFPEQCANRTQALHHLFVHIGNGYEWRDGELVNLYPLERDYTDDEIELQMLPDILERFKTLAAESDAKAAMVESMLAEAREGGVERLAIRRDADRLAETPGDLRGPVHQPCQEYAYLLNAPKDITPDWAAAREEIAAVVAPLWASEDYLRSHQEKHYEQVRAISTLSVKNQRLLARLAAGRIRQGTAR